MIKEKKGLHIRNKGVTFLLCVLVATFFSNCSVAESAPITTIKTIKFGSSGGFTGERIVFELKQTGELYKNTVLLKTVSADVIKNHFEQANALMSISFSEKGNLSRFMEIETNTEKKEFVWHTASQQLDERIPALYQSLFNLTR